MQLKTLTYVSRASLDLAERDLIDILETARLRNALEGITGVLIFNGVRFLQIIEGAEAAIDSLVAGDEKPGAVASIVTGVPLVNSMPVAAKDTVFCPAPTVTVSGTEARLGSELLNVIVTPLGVV